MRYTLGFDNMTYVDKGFAVQNPGAAIDPGFAVQNPGAALDPGFAINKPPAPLPADTVQTAQPGINNTPAAGKAAVDDRFPWWLLLVAGAAWYI